MGQVGGAYLRLRPALAAEDDAEIAALANSFRSLADQLDEFRSHFVRAEPDAPVVHQFPFDLNVETSIPLRFALEGGTT